ncbi:MAG TPA: CDP-diacylglycerol--glycerol-3-phosphate 3-phosphatidyltransferase [Bacilli bacterium]|nr:CDP-diacylglycerol--glycerol-3-phosphate 3-phosphatidyltransferase [Bacilli bacterium]
MKINPKLPNYITIFRMGMVVVILIILLLPWQQLVGNIPFVFANVNLIYFIALILFLIASISDFFDGYLARKYNLISNFGKFMDPIADKMLVNTLLIVLLVKQAYAPQQISVPLLAVIIMIARDLVVDGLRLVASERKIVLAANIFGKVKTVLQMAAISVFLLNDWPFSLLYGATPYVSLVLIWAAATVSLLSGLIYVGQNYRVLKDEKHG